MPNRWMRMSHAWTRCLFAAVLGLAAAGARADLNATAWPARSATPALELPDQQGRSVSLSALKGRVVLINFWGTWCDPCREEMPTLQQLSDIYRPDQLTVLTVNVKDRPEKAAQFMRNAGLSMPVLRDPDGAVAKAWQVRVFPTTIVLSSDGKARWRVVGASDWTGREAGKLVADLLRPPTRPAGKPP